MVAEVIGVGTALSDPEALRHISILLFEELGGCDVQMGSFVSAGTNVQRLRGAISKALGRADIVFLLGGMGATEQDITKTIVCEGLGRKLVLHEPTLARIKAAYERAGRQMPRPVTKLAMMPEQSVVFPGVAGLTPGCALSAGQQFIIMLPDADKELTPMLHGSVVPYLAKFSGAAIGTRTINVFGKSEAEVKSAVARYLSLRNPTVNVESKEGEVQVVVTTRAKSKTEAAALSEPVIKTILGALGDAVYGVDQPSLQNVVIGALRANRMTIAVGEGGTGGRLTSLLEKTPSADAVFPFGVTANSQRNKQDALDVSDKLLKKYAPVSEQVAAAMADGARRQENSSIGVGITGDDPKKPGVFYIAVCDSQSVWVRKLTLAKTASGDYMRYFACLTALDLARRVIAALPGKLPGFNQLSLALTGKIPTVESAQAGDSTQAASTGKGKKRARSAGDLMRNVVLTLAIVTFVGSGSYLGWFYYQSYHNKSITKEFESMYVEGMDENATLTVPDDYPADYQKKFANLYSINEDVAGWLKIEDTQLSYPVVQYIDNVYYNRRDFYRKDNKHGVPWLEYRSAMEPQADNYVIYGHNMTDGQMFGELMNYKPSVGGLDFLQKHPIISMDDVYRDNEYKIMSVFITNAKEQYGEIFYYNYYTDLSDKAVFDEFINEITARSYYTSDVDVKQGDQFITLSTCSYEYGPVSADAHVRTVVVGRKVRPGEKADGSGITYKMNPEPKMPSGFTKDGGKAAAQSSGSSLLINASNAELPGASVAAGASASVPISASASVGASSKSSSGLTSEELEEIAYQEWLASSRAASRKESEALLEEERLQSEAEERRASRREEERLASEEAARISSEEEARLASEEAARISSDEAARKSSEEAAKKSSEEAARKSSEEEAARISSEEAARKSSEEEAARISSEEAAKKSSEEAAKSSEEAAKSSANEQASSGEILEPTTPGSSNNQSSEVLSASTNEKLSVSAGGKKVTAQASSLIPQIVMNELGSSFSDEAIKAQAVAAYTYVKFQNQTGVIPQMALKTPNSRVTKLCNEVLGEAVYYKNKLAFTPFFATSAGVTIASKDVWGGSYPYLVSVDSWVDEQADRYETAVTYSAADAAKRVKNALGVDLYAFSGNPADWFSILSYADGGDQYVKQLQVGDKTITGRTFRESVMGLRSAAFDISYRANSDSFVFTSYGYGHGVGMSQTGAQLFAREEGWDYVQILEHYYSGAVVK